MNKKSFYITTPIFYPNANPHMGHAYATLITDIIARYHELKGEEKYFLTGTDENTGKILKSAEATGKNVPEYLKEVTQNFKNLYKDLNISYDQFIQTSDKKVHWPGALKMWNTLVDNGDIYPSTYEGLYCSACEAFYTEKDLIDGKCPYHGTTPEMLKEKNYFFKLSKYSSVIKEKIETGELEIIPETRKNEILAFIDRGLEDVSFSRPKNTAPHAIPVPGDPDQVIYVWCDALVNYISALGYGTDEDSKYKKFWPANCHVIGKDILRFHAAIWPGMLLAAGIPLPKKILVHGFITSGGKKMSKSLGNVIDPSELVSEFGGEAVRYFLARKISVFNDGDMTKESFKEAYNSDLANGLGNLVSRVLTMSENNNILARENDLNNFSKPIQLLEPFQHIENYELNEAMDDIWNTISKTDALIQTDEAFKKIKTNRTEAEICIKRYLLYLIEITIKLRPFLPKTSEIIEKLIKTNKKPETPLFPRKD